jgi:hypothetical protein
MFPVNRDGDLRIIDFDCVMVRRPPHLIAQGNEMRAGRRRRGAALRAAKMREGDEPDEVKSPEEKAGFIRHMHEERVTPAEVGKMAAAAGVKTVVMTHLSPTVNPNDDYHRYVVAAQKYFHGRIVLAKDLMDVRL